MSSRHALAHAASTSSPAQASFAAVLRDATHDVHREAERAGFIADLIRGRASRAGYALFLRNLLPVYAALEALLDRLDARFAPFRDTRLQRRDALSSDLVAVAGPDAMSLEVTEATHAYVAAIEEAANQPPLLVAHAYARYMGDLSGGQILAPLIGRSLAVDASALAFYRFEAVADLGAQKARMRDALDLCTAGSPEAEAITDEALRAFRHNIELSTAVQARAAR